MKKTLNDLGALITELYKKDTTAVEIITVDKTGARNTHDIHVFRESIADLFQDKYIELYALIKAIEFKEWKQNE